MSWNYLHYFDNGDLLKIFNKYYFLVSPVILTKVTKFQTYLNQTKIVEIKLLFCNGHF